MNKLLTFANEMINIKVADGLQRFKLKAESLINKKE